MAIRQGDCSERSGHTIEAASGPWSPSFSMAVFHGQHSTGMGLVSLAA